MSHSRFKKQTVLIVDDSPLVLDALSSLIEGDYEVLVAVNGTEALGIALTESPDLILLDVVMPGQDGYAVLSALKSSSGTADIPVIFLTSLDDENDEVKGLRMGAVDYITKPFRPEVVQARVRTHLELKRSRDILRGLALRDGLTGIANRRCFNDRLDLEWSRCLRTDSPLSLIMIDIDHFKLYNDCYGHLSGDSCIIQVGQILENETLRPSDLVARFGGEEFVLLLPETGIPGALFIAERIQTQLQTLAIPHEHSPVDPHVTLSMGIASIIPVPGKFPEQLIQEADLLLYKAKQRGRNQIQSNTSMGTMEVSSDHAIPGRPGTN